MIGKSLLMSLQSISGGPLLAVIDLVRMGVVNQDLQLESVS